MSTASSGRRTTAVFGLRFGDEGKGQVVDRLAAEHDVVVRYNGGANAGHSVVVGGDRLALRLLPSGALVETTRLVIAGGTFLDLEILAREIATLRDRGVDLSRRLLVSDRAHVVLPWHREEDRLRDALAARDLGPERSIGTTGSGIGPAAADRAHRLTAFRVGDLLAPGGPAARIRHASDGKNATLGALAAALGEAPLRFDADAIEAEAVAAATAIRPFVGDATEALGTALAAGERLLFEGAHSALLDVDHGTFPYVTSSHGTPLGIAAGTGLPPFRPDRTIAVAKAYMSRVGNGPFPTELDGEEARRLRERGREFGTTTGRPRRVGHLDLVLARDAARRTGTTEVALTGLGVLAGAPSVRFATAWRVRGERTQRVPAAAEDAFDAVPDYEERPGWEGPLDGIRAFDDLPAAARDFVAEIGRRVAPVSFVAVGPGREALLAVRR